MRERWLRFLCSDRLGQTRAPQAPDPARTSFQVDYDRIVFSTAFRRLHDKTQVFPLPDNDLVHSRLTHSLEVSCVGRSLGIMAGQVLAKRHGFGPDDPTDRSFGDIVAAACLAHDIGNPPFGHAGEDAIARWFKNHFEKAPERAGEMTDAERHDLASFEGNAQGFRILTRLQNPKRPGLRLTLATLAAFTKYPREAGPKPKTNAVSLKKHSIPQTELAAFTKVADGVGLESAQLSVGGWALRAWQRHPLAFLVEAADDICYSILDIEDGYRLGYVPFEEVFDRLSAIAARDPTFRHPHKPASDDERKDLVGVLRAIAINRLTTEVVEVFLDHENDIVAGKFEKALADRIPSAAGLDGIKETSRQTCYRARAVLEIELAGYKILGGLLDDLVPAVLARKPSSPQDKLLRVIPVSSPDPAATTYDRLIRVTDYLSGMTDSFAVRTYRQLTGISIGTV